VGQLTNLAAVQLTEEGYGTIACIALLAIGSESLVENSRNADEVVILDGCPMLCGKKIAYEKGLRETQHLVVTELGIPKGPSKSYSPDDIETIVSACWKGEGKNGISKPNEKKSGGKDGGCRCGCNGRC
jgi:uncharacterized metal-binding protein